MKRIIIILFIGSLLTSCRTTKKITKSEARDTTFARSENVQIEKSVREKHYDDTLRAEVPFESDSLPVTIESKGIRASVRVVSEKDNTGKIIARKMQIEAVAKPNKEIVSNTKITRNADTHVKATVQTTESAVVSRKSIRVFTIIGIAGFLIILYIIFPLLKQLFFKH